MVHVIIYFISAVLLICFITAYCRALRAIQILEKKVEGKVEQVDNLRRREKEKDAEIDDLKECLQKTETEFANFRRMVSERKITEDFQGLH